MNNKTLAIALLSLGCAFQSANAQLANKKGITLEEIGVEINTIAAKNNAESKVLLEKEAKALSLSKNESFVNFGAKIYSYIDKAEEADKVTNSILKKFPKGMKARQVAYEAIFNDEASSAKKAEKEYEGWLKKFPVNSFDSKSLGIYDQALSSLSILFLKENNITDANKYIQKLESSTNYPIYANTIATTLLKDGKYKEALPILEKAYNLSLNAIQSTDPKIKNSAISSRYSSLAALYGKALAESGEIKKSTDILQLLFKKSANSSTNPSTVLLLARNLAKQGQELDGFLTLQNYVTSNEQNEEITKELQQVYNRLNKDQGDYNAYIDAINAQIKEQDLLTYKSEMIKKEAPNFSLLNREGKTVSLADLKGKVVVIDFWATWCGPCKISMPGMQAAANKFKDDKEVEFLFIDTWQREENYKELVDKFMEQNKYTFNVLFDEMKDKSKFTTTAFGVKGIPHKVVIDKEGFIRFESSGGSADVNKIVNEFSTKIELAKKG